MNHFLKESKKEEIQHHPRVGNEGPRSPVGNQAGVEKFVIGIRTNSNRNDQDMINGTTA